MKFNVKYQQMAEFLLKELEMTERKQLWNKYVLNAQRENTRTKIHKWEQEIMKQE